jgi:hypothetical protein
VGRHVRGSAAPTSDTGLPALTWLSTAPPLAALLLLTEQ